MVEHAAGLRNPSTAAVLANRFRQARNGGEPGPQCSIADCDQLTNGKASREVNEGSLWRCDRQSSHGGNVELRKMANVAGHAAPVHRNSFVGHSDVQDLRRTNWETEQLRGGFIAEDRTGRKHHSSGAAQATQIIGDRRTDDVDSVERVRVLTATKLRRRDARSASLADPKRLHFT